VENITLKRVPLTITCYDDDKFVLNNKTFDTLTFDYYKLYNIEGDERYSILSFYKKEPIGIKIFRRNVDDNYIVSEMILKFVNNPSFDKRKDFVDTIFSDDVFYLYPDNGKNRPYIDLKSSNYKSIIMDLNYITLKNIVGHLINRKSKYITPEERIYVFCNFSNETYFEKIKTMLNGIQNIDSIMSI